MIDPSYRAQVDLLLAVLPEVAKEDCFALHGGTAINLFIRNLPRLSVDIDLTYVPLENRNTSLENIRLALLRIQENIQNAVPNCTIEHKVVPAKLIVRNQEGTTIKIEVNKTNRGIYGDIVYIDLCERAQEEFDAFCYMPIVPFGQLFGGKICAALDRQHPRDLFDVRNLLDQEGITADIKDACILTLLSSNRPLHELLAPNYLDQETAMVNQFQGMAEADFSYEEFHSTRLELVQSLNGSFTPDDKKFFIGFHQADPDWGLYDLAHFPSIQWKLQNLEIFKTQNPNAHKAMMDELHDILGLERSTTE